MTTQKNTNQAIINQTTVNQTTINQTKQWLEEIIVGMNFCPFAKKELVSDTIHYYVSNQGQTKQDLEEVIEQCR